LEDPECFVSSTDAWKGFRYAFRRHKQDEEITIREFADRLAFELLHNNFDNGGSAATKTLNVLSPLRSPARRSPRLLKLSQKCDEAVLNGNFVVEISEATVSPLASTLTKSTASKKVQADALWMQLMELHKHEQIDGVEATGRKIRRHCAFCKNKTGWQCKTCKVYCCPEMTKCKKPWNCYKEHPIAAHPSY
jgi:hypothetical protein